MPEFHTFGEPLPCDAELEANTRSLLQAVLHHHDFKVVEERAVHGAANTIIVDCFCAGVPSRNGVGIRNRERLALQYAPGEPVPHQVRPLRKGFPTTPHQNHVPEGEPASLCMYYQPWSHLERSWTPELHLHTILWWLENCSNGTLHPETQPVEQLYFASPTHLVLPADFDEKSRSMDQQLSIREIRHPSTGIEIVRTQFVTRKGGLGQVEKLDIVCLNLPPAMHGSIEIPPHTLGELNDQLGRRGSVLIDELISEFGRIAEGVGVATSPRENRTLLLLNIPVRRTQDAAPERADHLGFVASCSLTSLGELSGTLFSPKEGRHHLVADIGQGKKREVGWRRVPIWPLVVEHSITLPLARMFSGLDSSIAEFNAVLAGVGSLGSALASIWAREGWGKWTYIDDDYIAPHNLARHVALDSHIGTRKVDAISQLVASAFSVGYLRPMGISARVNDGLNDEVNRAIADAQFVVDATTTLEVPRDLSQRRNVPRSASVFVTPSGLCSVVLMEDKRQTVRLDALEAQYYRGVVRSEWGGRHLAGHRGEVWVGAGCRDISAVIPYDLVLLHAGLLARRVRESRLADEAAIEVWEFADGRRAVTRNDVPVAAPSESILKGWTVVWDAEILSTMKTLRASKLPKETGGVVVGYYDQKLHRIYVVDVLDAPQDSEEGETGFIRGTEDLRQRLVDISQRTANIVEYIGEWHSHPPQSSAWPSGLDIALLTYLSERLATEGKPSLMMILGESSISFLLE